MNFLTKLPWKRLLTIAAGIVTEAAAGDPAKLKEQWPAVLMGALGGLAINGEKLMAKRKKGPPPFDAAAAEAKVEKMKAP